MGRHLSPRCDHVKLVSDTLLCQLLIDHNMDVQYQVASSQSLFIVYCFVCHNMYKAKKMKLFELSWRGSPREATGLIRNGLPQLDN